MGEELEVVEIWRKTKDGDDTFWLVCMDGYCRQFVSGETKLHLLLNDGHDA